MTESQEHLSGKFRIGQTVVHQTGGPMMAVVLVNAEREYVSCQWFNEQTGSFEERDFVCAVLWIMNEASAPAIAGAVKASESPSLAGSE